MNSNRVLLSAILVALLIPTLSLAEANISLNGVGGRLGFVMPEDPIDNTIGLGLNADLGTLMPNLSLWGYLDFWSKGYDAGYYEWSWTSIAIAAIAKYEFEMEGDIKPYAGGGLGFTITSWNSDYTGPAGFGFDASTSDSNFDIGLHFLGGAAKEFSPQLTGFAELKYSIDGADYFGIYVGVSYKLNK